MSVDAYVLYNKELRSVAEWQRGLDDLALPLVLASDRRIETLGGHLPAWWDRREAGFECKLCDVGDLLSTYNDIDFGGPWQYAMALNWGTFQGCAGAWMAAAALARVMGGVVFDPQESALLDPAASVAYARDTVASMPDLEAMLKGVQG